MRGDRLADVRKALERRHGPIPDEVWKALVTMGIAEVGLGGEGDMEYVAEQLRPLLGLWVAARGRKAVERRAPREEHMPPDERLRAFAEILALEAARRPDVQAFRRDVLDDRLVHRDELADWIRARAAEDGPPTAVLRVAAAVQQDAVPIAGQGAAKAAAALKTLAAGRIFELEYARPTLAFPDGSAAGGGAVVRIAYGGVLWRLKRLVRELGREYGWHEPGAVAFVVCGVVPDLPRGVIKLHRRGRLERITLELDPRLSRSEVARLYGRWRRLVFRGPDRPVGPRTARLAVFAEQHRLGGLSWRQLVDVWNRQHPQWPYHSAAHLARDCQAAWQRVTGEKWPGKKEGKRRGKEARSR